MDKDVLDEAIVSTLDDENNKKDTLSDSNISNMSNDTNDTTKDKDQYIQELPDWDLKPPFTMIKRVNRNDIF